MALKLGFLERYLIKMQVLKFKWRINQTKYDYDMIKNMKTRV